MENNLLKIQNDHFVVSVNKIGAELSSFLSVHSNTEFIWKADASVWGSSAPVLFPIVGALKDGFFLYGDQKYFIPKHGFIRNNKNLKIEEHLNDSLTLSFQNSLETEKIFPFEFRFEITFRLINSKLEISHKVTNLSNEKSLYFSLGGHPAFNCPFFEGEEYEDYYIEFQENENSNRWNVLGDGTIESISKPFLNNSSTINLSHSLFLKDALIFKDLKSKKINLKSHKHSTVVEVSFDDFHYLGIWSKPEGDFVCIEPWLGISDSCQTNHLIEDKEGVICLPQSECFISKYFITIKEGIL